ncbi:helix-turn-helix domain-containing protein [Leclercia adecarboxylata]|uniref:helix-turn-helix domain-containing protein n=1 Tax=Leclercia adecarboxylata TaxID=83655 RepID=UPI001CEFACDC|nr:helix-turn-helix transcriptional regulator [Leclercia adecarboxylata]
MFDEHGNRTSAVLPIEMYQELLDAAEREDDYVTVPYVSREDDNETIPHDVISIMIDEQVTLQAAWRIYRRMSQVEVAEKLGIKQSAVSQLEKSANPRSNTLSKLAELYECRPSQLTLN